MSVLSTVADYFPLLPKPRPKFVTETGKRVFGMIAIFDETPKVYHAAEKVRDAGYTKWDVNSPFPIHGMEEAMGVRKTILPYIVFGAGLGGAIVVGGGMQWWMTWIDYPIIVQGKPYEAWEPFIPIIFEMGVLHAAFAALIGMLALNGLPRFSHPLFSSAGFLKTSDDRFVIGIEAEDKNFDPDATKKLLEDIGGKDIELIEEDA
ncbi:MAG: DUF3341 domain-containing protein [Planctomycetota bacterium]